MDAKRDPMRAKQDVLQSDQRFCQEISEESREPTAEAEETVSVKGIAGLDLERKRQYLRGRRRCESGNRPGIWRLLHYKEPDARS